MPESQQSLEIVTHCFAEDIGVYATLLDMQLQSILNEPPRDTNTKVTVFWTPSDIRTDQVLRWHRYQFSNSPVFLYAREMPKDQLFRRAIGRNEAALLSDADVLWFTDCDHLFGCGAIDQAARLSIKQRECDDAPKMIHPETVMISRNHAAGDHQARVFEKSRMIDYLEFAPRKERRAWGGLQIVDGEFCRKMGYLGGTEHIQPVENPKRFLRCRGDVPFRKACGGSRPAKIPGVYRVRHSLAGRDGGTVDHGAK